MSSAVPTEVPVQAARSGCLHEDGQRTTYETTAMACSDGRTLYWNEAGWGYDDGAWHPRGFDETAPVPREERADCGRPG